MVNLLFVYGTLRSGFDNQWAKMLRLHSDFLGPATVFGTLHQFGNYPAFRPVPAGEVTGELYRLHTPETTLSALDEYEGDEYERVTIATTGGEAWIYRSRMA